MKVPVCIVFGLLLTTSTMSEDKELRVLQANSQFSSDIYNILSKTDGNIIFSPISIHAVLSMAYQGAQGTTAEKFSSALKVPEARTAAEGYNTVMNRLNSVENVSLLMANKIFLMEGYQMLPDFSSAVTKNFLSEVQLVNFKENVAAAKTINDWVEKKTNEKIKDLIEADDLDQFTRLVLVNAIYFKGNWKRKFNKEATKIEPFYLNDVDTVDVQMMHTEQKFNYKVDGDLDAQLLEMKYTNEDLSMIIILPNKRNGIAELEKKLANASLSDLTNGMYERKVIVSLPRFKIEQTIDLKDTLTEIGLGEIFDQDRANFRGMIPLKPSENLYVSKVVQKAFIEVNEEGAEAAAATGLGMVMLCSLEIDPLPEFVVDHPFVYVLSHKGTNQLFGGRVTKPNL